MLIPFRLRSRTIYPWIFGFGVLLIFSLVSNYAEAKDYLSTLLTAIGAWGGIMAFLYSQHCENTKIFRELFKEFNERYTGLNDKMNEIHDRPIGVKLEEKNYPTLHDYFNLCGEEFMYWKAGFIDPNVWDSWQKGMAYFAEDPEIRIFWEHEVQQGSYYGFTLDFKPAKKSCLLKTNVLGLLIVAFVLLATGSLWAQSAAEVKDYKSYLEVKRKVDQGDAVALYQMGQVLEEGLWEEKDDEKAIVFLIKSSDQGFSKAMFKLGYKYYHGEAPIKKNIPEAIKLFTKASQLNDAGGFHGLATIYRDSEYSNKDMVKSAKFLQKSIDLESNSQQILWYAQSLENGNENYAIVKNSTEAIKYFVKASEMGDAKGQYKIGMKYYSGEGVEKNTDTALKWLDKAAAQNEGDALCQLGNMYAIGENVIKSQTNAERLWKKAIANKNRLAEYNLKGTTIKGYVVAKDYAEAFSSYKVFAEAGDPLAQYYLGKMYFLNDGVNINDYEKQNIEAMRWHKKSSDQKYAPAQYELVRPYVYGKYGIKKDKLEGSTLLYEAAKSGHLEAQNCLGVLLQDKYNWLGLSPNKVEALMWLRKASLQGSQEADFHLAKIYETGIKGSGGVDKNFIEALQIYKRLSNDNFLNAKIRLCELFAKSWNNLLYFEIINGRMQYIIDKDEMKSMIFDLHEKGFIDSYYLGLAYANGNGVPQCDHTAVYYYRKSRNSDAKYYLAYMLETGRGVIQNLAEAIRIYKDEAGNYNVNSTVRLGLIYAIGKGVPKNEEKALGLWNSIDFSSDIHYFENIAEENPLAQYKLGTLYEVTDGPSFDLNKALACYRKAHDGGVIKAGTRIGALALDANKPSDALEWLKASADQDDAEAQFLLGGMYFDGIGVVKDRIEALIWYNLSARSGFANAAKMRDLLEKAVGPNATLRAQERSKEILKNIQIAKEQQDSLPSGGSAQAAAATIEPKGTGTAAIISAKGHALTAAHVVKGAKEIKARTAKGLVAVKVLSVDTSNDLAVLFIEGGLYKPLPMAPSKNVRLGQTVATIGFPNVDFQGFSPKVTRGEISSLKGFSDDPRNWQISVPLQPGNSGGPLLDEKGNLVGIVLSKLSLNAALQTGDIAQNVNYAVKNAYSMLLLEAYPEAVGPAPRETPLKFEDMVAQVQDSVVLILVY